MKKPAFPCRACQREFSIEDDAPEEEREPIERRRYPREVPDFAEAWAP